MSQATQDSPSQHSRETTSSDRVTDSKASSPTLAIPLIANQPASEVTPLNQVRNPIVAQDLRLCGAFWNDENDVDQDEAPTENTPVDASNYLNIDNSNPEADFQVVLSKSKKKKLKQKAKANQKAIQNAKHNTRRGSPKLYA